MYQVIVIGWFGEHSEFFELFNDAVEYGMTHSFVDFVIKDISTRADNGEYVWSLRLNRVVSSPGTVT